MLYAMSPEALAYPFLFIAIFFESFVLVTLLSAPARAARARGRGAATPSVAIIVPCWNEASTIAATCESLFALDYPKEKLEVILVDDGSTDATPGTMARFARHPQVRIVRKEENGGKHTALNAGIALTRADLVGCLDADSFVEPDALREIIACFDDPRVVAATAAMSVHKPGNILQHMQNAEYAFGITIRHTFASVNGLYVTPGPFSFYRRAVVEELGGFRYGHQTEDMEMALRIQKAGYGIENAPHARVYTKAPATIGGLMRQRTRWISGFLRNVLGEYRDLVGRRRHGVLGVLVLPTALLAIMSGILLFLLALFILMQKAITALEVRAGIPLSYAFLPHGTFDWFYFPASFYLLLAIIVLLTSIALIAIGKRISKTPGSITLDLISYTFLYGLLVPFWLIRATSDVALGIRRGWRY
ncbi:MAG: Glycosyltransferase involved in cell wall biogenesis [Parcubacteria group bacterium GW2011_GWB1_55_9]|nr:MAG: Glycosyltransferase involved in cell wall biogenesis [Parcubacteria group bacterium GW2011_GWB1_55_9]